MRVRPGERTVYYRCPGTIAMDEQPNLRSSFAAGATYVLATRVATVRELAAEAGVPAHRVDDPGTHPWLTAMFAYYDAHGLPVGTRVLASLLR